jgi:hypothetical protein
MCRIIISIIIINKIIIIIKIIIVIATININIFIMEGAMSLTFAIFANATSKWYESRSIAAVCCMFHEIFCANLQNLSVSRTLFAFETRILTLPVYTRHNMGALMFS